MDENSSQEGDVLSRGAKAKADGKVISLMSKNTDNLANVRCRISNFGFILEDFCDVKKKWVTEMGFDGLFSMISNGLPRTLCYWLATRVDVSKKVFESVDGIRFPLTSVQVQCVLGLPRGSKPVPNKVSESMRAEVDDIKATMTSVTEGKQRGILASTIAKAVKAPLTDEVKFKRSFLMLALNEVLCSTSCPRFSPMLLPAATVYMNAKEYDWCSLVIDHLMHSLSYFKSTFDSKGFAKSCGGCLMFLVIFYLDRLQREPLSWGVYPRLEVWIRNEITKAQKEDTTSSGDFGELGCFDLAYGEKHPYFARDVPPATMPSEASVQCGFYDKPIVRRGRKRRDSNCNPYQYRMNKLKKMITNDDVSGSGFRTQFEGSLPRNSLDLNYSNSPTSNSPGPQYRPHDETPEEKTPQNHCKVPYLDEFAEDRDDDEEVPYFNDSTFVVGDMSPTSMILAVSNLYANDEGLQGSDTSSLETIVSGSSYELHEECNGEEEKSFQAENIDGFKTPDSNALGIPQDDCSNSKKNTIVCRRVDKSGSVFKMTCRRYSSKSKMTPGHVMAWRPRYIGIYKKPLLEHIMENQGDVLDPVLI